MGGHPAFNGPAPGGEGEAFDDYELAFTKPWSCVAPKICDGGLLTYRTAEMVIDRSDVLPIAHELFAADAVMLSEVPDDTLTLRSRVSGHGVKIDFPGFKYIGIWSAEAMLRLSRSSPGRGMRPSIPRTTCSSISATSPFLPPARLTSARLP